MKTTLVIQETIGGEDLRIDTGQRVKTRTAPTKSDSRTWALVDTGTPTNYILWTATASNISAPYGVAIITDPDNQYADGLTTAPAITVEVTYADDTSGTNPTVMVIDVPREYPLVIPGTLRAALTSASSGGKVLYQLRARNNQASGYGTIKLRVLIL